MKTLWLDCETTGLDYTKDCIIELACIYEEIENNKLIRHDTFRQYCLPDHKPSDFDKIEQLTGIKWETLEEQGFTQRELYNAFINFLDDKVDRFDKTDKMIFAAYNAKFDNQFLRELFLRNNNKYFGSYFYTYPLDIPSTVVMCYMLGLIEKPENFKNETIARLLKIKGIETAALHSALIDIQFSREIQLVCQEKLKEWGQQKNVS